MGGHPRPYVQGHGPSDFPTQSKQTWARESSGGLDHGQELSGFYSRASRAQPRISDDTGPRHGGAAVITEATSTQTTTALGAHASRSPCPLAGLWLLVPISCVATALPRTLPCSSFIPPIHPFKSTSDSAPATLLLPEQHAGVYPWSGWVGSHGRGSKSHECFSYCVLWGGVFTQLCPGYDVDFNTLPPLTEHGA